MRNKPNFRKSQMNVSVFTEMVYENKSNWTLGENKPNTNPIKAKTKPIKANFKPKTNPILSRRSLGEGGQTQFQAWLRLSNLGCRGGKIKKFFNF